MSSHDSNTSNSRFNNRLLENIDAKLTSLKTYTFQQQQQQQQHQQQLLHQQKTRSLTEQQRSMPIKSTNFAAPTTQPIESSGTYPSRFRLSTQILEDDLLLISNSQGLPQKSSDHSQHQFQQQQQLQSNPFLNQAQQLSTFRNSLEISDTPGKSSFDRGNTFKPITFPITNTSQNNNENINRLILGDSYDLQSAGKFNSSVKKPPPYQNIHLQKDLNLQQQQIQLQQQQKQFPSRIIKSHQHCLDNGSICNIIIEPPTKRADSSLQNGSQILRNNYNNNLIESELSKQLIRIEESYDAPYGGITTHTTEPNLITPRQSVLSHHYTPSFVSFDYSKSIRDSQCRLTRHSFHNDNSTSYPTMNNNQKKSHLKNQFELDQELRKFSHRLDTIERASQQTDQAINAPTKYTRSLHTLETEITPDRLESLSVQLKAVAHALDQGKIIPKGEKKIKQEKNNSIKRDNSSTKNVNQIPQQQSRPKKYKSMNSIPKSHLYDRFSVPAANTIHAVSSASTTISQKTQKNQLGKFSKSSPKHIKLQSNTVATMNTNESNSNTLMTEIDSRDKLLTRYEAMIQSIQHENRIAFKEHDIKIYSLEKQVQQINQDRKRVINQTLNNSIDTIRKGDNQMLQNNHKIQNSNSPQLTKCCYIHESKDGQTTSKRKCDIIHASKAMNEQRVQKPPIKQLSQHQLKQTSKSKDKVKVIKQKQHSCSCQDNESAKIVNKYTDIPLANDHISSRQIRSRSSQSNYTISPAFEQETIRNEKLQIRKIK